MGGKGDSDTRDAGAYGDIVALCDIDEDRLDRMGEKFPKAKKFTDYRKMLEVIGDKIDAVTVSTPDHSHAPASVRAMRMGKHTFCQKPLTWSVEEARLMRTLAAEKKPGDPDGQPGHLARRVPLGRGADPLRRPRSDPGDPRLDQPADLAARGQPAQGHPGYS